jgi:hypothetical protein
VSSGSRIKLGLHAVVGVRAHWLAFEILLFVNYTAVFPSLFPIYYI